MVASPGAPTSHAGGYETAVIVAGGANLLAVLIALTLPRQNRAQRSAFVVDRPQTTISGT